MSFRFHLIWDESLGKSIAEKDFQILQQINGESFSQFTLWYRYGVTFRYMIGKFSIIL
ncbi:hypothetical protein RirG_031020 [Rhizophagus irregularis DAOM 197198w]|uniref:Uncharacterized protein n=1 Tax=Rhizophagus irregularis (strain DAOM 197198w) TaxID=1432141 RepID=A0A015LAF8_RHIIW|nr:hypothetical protein RirG_031020 [Rhizophagus irregularis DAOM 197198w]